VYFINFFKIRKTEYEIFSYLHRQYFLNICQFVYAIKKIALNEKEIQSVSQELDMISKLKSEFVVDYVYSWVEKNYITNYKDYNSSGQSISYGHPVLDPLIIYYYTFKRSIASKH
jgi:hypothetical protein